MAVREHDRVDLVETVPDPGEVRQDHVDAWLVLLGEEDAAVDDEQPPGVLEDRHVAADLAQSTQGNDPKAVARQRGEALGRPPGAASPPTRLRPATATRAHRPLPGREFTAWQSELAGACSGAGRADAVGNCGVMVILLVLGNGGMARKPRCHALTPAGAWPSGQACHGVSRSGSGGGSGVFRVSWSRWGAFSGHGDRCLHFELYRRQHAERGVPLTPCPRGITKGCRPSVAGWRRSSPASPCASSASEPISWPPSIQPSGAKQRSRSENHAPGTRQPRSASAPPRARQAPGKQDRGPDRTVRWFDEVRYIHVIWFSLWTSASRTTRSDY